VGSTVADVLHDLALCLERLACALDKDSRIPPV